MEEDISHEVTEILARIRQDSDTATAALLPLLYKELRALAGSYFRRESPDHTLQQIAARELFLPLFFFL